MSLERDGQVGSDRAVNAGVSNFEYSCYDFGGEPAAASLISLGPSEKLVARVVFRVVVRPKPRHAAEIETDLFRGSDYGDCDIRVSGLRAN